MSEIRANTVSNAAGTGPVTLTGQSAAKAWVNFNGSAFATRDSFNLSSLVDNGGGDYTSNFASAFAAGDYSTTLSANRGISNTTLFNGCRIADYLTTPTGSAFRFAHGLVNGVRDFQLEDASYMSMTAHGDLA